MTDKKINKEQIDNVVPLKQIPAGWENINPMSFNNIVESKPLPVEYAMFPWLPVQGIAFIYAATGVGKTLFSMNVAYAIASGGNFLKYKCPKPRRVLYIDGEMAYTQVHSRLMQIVEQQGKLEDEDNFFLFTPDKANIRPIKICQPEGQEFYNRKIEENRIEVVVFDNLSVLSAIDENSSSEWKVIQDWLLSLRAKGVTIIVIHHSGKDKNGYRGSSRMLDCADSAISLQPISNDQGEQLISRDHRFKVSYQKNRNFGGRDAMEFEVCLKAEGWSYESTEKNNSQRIVEMVNEFGMKPKDIAIELNIKQVTYVYRIIRDARRKGIIIK